MARSSVSARICARALPVVCARCSKLTASARNSPRLSQRRWFSLTSCCTCFGRRAAGAGLEQAAAVDQRDDREHLGAGAELQDREQVGEVVAQHVAGDRDGVLALADPLQRERDRVDRRHDLDLEAARCRARGGTACTLAMRLASWARLSSSQNTAGVAGGPGAGDGELDPVADRHVLGLAHPPDVAGARRRARARRRRPRRRRAPCRWSGSRRSCRGCRTPRPPAPSGRRWAPSPSWPGRRRRWRGSRR